MVAWFQQHVFAGRKKRVPSEAKDMDYSASVPLSKCAKTAADLMTTLAQLGKR